ncbi:glycosyltransferase [Nocardioides sp. IC4_145]|nr:glycosyltransferase [Nocardioides sp. IC4_145]
MADAFAESGSDVVLSRNATAEYFNECRSRSGPAQALEDPVRTYGSAWTALLAFLRIPILTWRFRRLVNRRGPSIVISAMENYLQSVVVPLSIPRSSTYVFCVHDGNFHAGAGNILQRIGRALEIRRADFVLALSDDSAARIRQQRRFLDKQVVTSVHPAFSGVVNSEPRSLPAHPRVGFVGRLEPYKGLDIYAQVAEIAASAHLPWDFEVWGAGSAGDDPEILDPHGLLQWNVGWVRESSFEELIRSFDVLVLPYRDASQSGVIAWAMSCGVPVVSTPVGGIERQVRDSGGGLVASSVDASAVHDALSRLLTDASLYRACSEAAIAASNSSYSWRRLVSDLSAAVSQ